MMDEYETFREIGVNRVETSEMFTLHILHRFLALHKKPMPRQTLRQVVSDLRPVAAAFGLDAFLPRPGDLDHTICVLVRDNKIYPRQLRGGRGTFEEHLMIAPAGVAALAGEFGMWVRRMAGALEPAA